MVRENFHPRAGSEKTQRALALILAVAVSTDTHLIEIGFLKYDEVTTAIVALFLKDTAILAVFFIDLWD